MVHLLMRNTTVLRPWEKKRDELLFIFMLKPSYFWTFGGLSVEEGLMLQRSRFRLNIKVELLQSEMSLARKHSTPPQGAKGSPEGHKEHSKGLCTLERAQIAK